MISHHFVGVLARNRALGRQNELLFCAMGTSTVRLFAIRFLDDVYKSRFKEGLVCVGLWTQRRRLCLRWIAGNRE